mmetsp:Transcript_4196/g.4598  ORF Transcript_4196/g.4598 Transcript_4196/m.4598 type:complete len:92 (+) Transcript_4196:92-367(+)
MTTQQTFISRQSNKSLISTMNLLTIKEEEAIDQLRAYNSAKSLGRSMSRCKSTKFDLASLASIETQISQSRSTPEVNSFEWGQFVDASMTF